MLMLFLRPILGLAGLGVAAGSGYALARVEPNEAAANLLISGGWVLIALMGIACAALLVSGFATAVLHIQDRGHGAPPSASD